MAIRTAVLATEGGGFRGEYLTGGGIVADSDPARGSKKPEKAAALAGAARRLS